MVDKKMIASFLKQLRKTSGKTAKEVVQELAAYNSNISISDKTLNGYENEISMPNADVFMSLCAIYHCDNPMELIFSGYSSEENRDFLFKFNALDPHGKRIVDFVLSEEYDRCQKARPVTRVYTYYRRIACAGDGFVFDDIPAETIEASECLGADFIIGVNGDAMEPTFYDGELVYVRRADDVRIGAIGIFTANNECFIKERGEECLVSHNPNYPNIPGTKDIRCVGEVLGKVAT